MANDKRFAVKNGLRTENINFENNQTSKKILAEIDSLGTLSLSNTLSGTVLSIKENGSLQIGGNTGNLVIGTTPDNGVDRLQVDGRVSASLYQGNLEGTVQGNVVGQDSTTLIDSETLTHFGQFVGEFVSSGASVGPSGVVGDVFGSVFANNSTLLVNGDTGTIVLDYNTTDDLEEGTNNLYYTKKRVRQDSAIMSIVFGS